jgi:hypothetical protein
VASADRLQHNEPDKLSQEIKMQNKKFPQSTSNHAQSPVKVQSTVTVQNSNNVRDGKQPHQPVESTEKDGN